MLALALGLLCQTLACRKSDPIVRGSAVAAPPDGGGSDPQGFRYPAGRWRLATFEVLDRATLWVGHIAIRHQSSEVVTFRPPNWNPDPPNPSRSVAQALALAEKIRAQAVATPDQFESLARQHSEDIVTKDEGGMMGGVRASQLMANDFLDVLAAIKPGEVSQVFRTPYGFHILKRYPRPSDTKVAGERIVIGYEGVYAVTAPSTRTRAQALALASRIAEQAQKDPGSFRALVDRHSENVDREAHGDMGLYSTTDPGIFPAEINRLSRVGIDEVTGPMDSRFGFEILKRVAATPRQEYAMAAIEIAPDGNPAGPEGDLAQAFEKAAGLRRELEKAPGKFEEFQRNHCCDRIQRWTAGRGDRAVTAVLDTLAFGEVAAKPVRQGRGFLLVKRLDPRRLPPEPPRLEDVPNPTEPDYQALMAGADGAQVAAMIKTFLASLGAAPSSAAFPPDAMKTIGEMLGKLAVYLEQTGAPPVETQASVRSTMASLEKQLGAKGFAAFRAFGRQWLISQLMPPGSVN